MNSERFKVEPGIYGMAEEEYHRGAGHGALSKSLLVELAKSPQHCKKALETFTEPTPAMMLGTALHMAVLEPEKFQARYAAFSGDRRTKAGKAAYNEIIEAGKTPLNESDMSQIKAMKDSILTHPFCREALSFGLPEVSLFWHPEGSPVTAKGRVDFLNPEEALIIDLKTARDASPEGFRKAAAGFKYHWQAYWYVQGVTYLIGPASWRFIFIAIEKTPPYAVGVYELHPDDIEAASEQVDPLIMTFEDCQRSGEWPGYSPEIETLHLPSWALFPGENSGSFREVGSDTVSRGTIPHRE